MVDRKDGPVFRYTEEATAYLKSRDKRLGEAMELIGPVRRSVTPHLFAALVNSIVGQQISTKAQVTIWERMQVALGEITPERIGVAAPEEIQDCGISMRKTQYIKDAAQAILSGRLDLEALKSLPDDQVCRQLSALRGVGVWTAEMLMLFSMERPDILSYDDLAIQRGMRMLYRHRTISREQFERYRRRYSPYGSVASLYLWAIASGDYGHQDPAPNKKSPGKAAKGKQ